MWCVICGFLNSFEIQNWHWLHYWISFKDCLVFIEAHHGWSHPWRWSRDTRSHLMLWSMSDSRIFLSRSEPSVLPYILTLTSLMSVSECILRLSHIVLLFIVRIILARWLLFGLFGLWETQLQSLYYSLPSFWFLHFKQALLIGFLSSLIMASKSARFFVCWDISYALLHFSDLLVAVYFSLNIQFAYINLSAAA